MAWLSSCSARKKANYGVVGRSASSSGAPQSSPTPPRSFVACAAWTPPSGASAPAGQAASSPRKPYGCLLAVRGRVALAFPQLAQLPCSLLSLLALPLPALLPPCSVWPCVSVLCLFSLARPASALFAVALCFLPLVGRGCLWLPASAFLPFGCCRGACCGCVGLPLLGRGRGLHLRFVALVAALCRPLGVSPPFFIAKTSTQKPQRK